jgi:glycosyltransferase involved in cell wall biosynthesis
MDISVILPTYNRASSLQVMLDSFAKLHLPPGLSWELLLVDNNSSDTTASVIQQFIQGFGDQIRYVFEGRQGRSHALNAGIAEAKGDVIAFTDDDVVLDAGWLTNLYGAFADPSASAVAGRILPLWNHPKPDWLEMDGQQAIVNFDLGEQKQDIQIAPMGANSAFRKEIFAKYGVFRVDLGVSGSQHTITCDDTEFGGRLMAGREKIVYCPTALIYHPVDPERTTKQYFLRWYFYNGVSLTRTDGLPNVGVFYFGVPRWFIRDLAHHTVRWLLSFDARRRFHHKLRACRSAGSIVESFRLTRTRARLAAQPETS